MQAPPIQGGDAGPSSSGPLRSGSYLFSAGGARTGGGDTAVLLAALALAGLWLLMKKR